MMIRLLCCSLLVMSCDLDNEVGKNTKPLIGEGALPLEARQHELGSLTQPEEPALESPEAKWQLFHEMPCLHDTVDSDEQLSIEPMEHPLLLESAYTVSNPACSHPQSLKDETTDFGGCIPEDLESIHKINNTVDTRETVSLGNLTILPIDIFKQVVAYIGLKETNQVRQLNKSFYRLMTGYEHPGLVGVQHRPRSSSIHLDLWKGKKKIDFCTSQLEGLTPETIPSFPFYELVGKVKNLPQVFWPYIKYTHIHGISLKPASCRGFAKSNHIGLRDDYQDEGKIDDSKLKHLAACLQKSKVDQVNLACNRIKNSSAIDFIKGIQGTDIGMVNFRGNDLTNCGMKELAKSLEGTKVETIDLSDNFVKSIYGQEKETSQEIDDIGAEALIKNLKNTHVHTVYFNRNTITATGLQAIAEHLMYTKVRSIAVSESMVSNFDIVAFAKNLPHHEIHLHTLDFARCTVSSQAINEFIDALPDSRIDEFNLADNQINDQIYLGDFAKKLRLIDTHTLWLDNNGIDSEGAASFLGHLSGTNLHTLDLGFNKIGLEVVKWAKYLKNTNLRTLYLCCIDIEDTGALALAENLINSTIQAVDLSCNGLTLETQQFLKEHYSKISWKF